MGHFLKRPLGLMSNKKPHFARLLLFWQSSHFFLFFFFKSVPQILLGKRSLGNLFLLAFKGCLHLITVPRMNQK